jgi:hypothetical protein
MLIGDWELGIGDWGLGNQSVDANEDTDKSSPTLNFSEKSPFVSSVPLWFIFFPQLSPIVFICIRI